MKKILFAIAIVLTIGLAANAQGRDGFFSSWDNDSYNNRGTNPDFTPGVVLPNGIQMSDSPTNEDPQAPLGSGLLVLTALGAGYAVARKRRK